MPISGPDPSASNVQSSRQRQFLVALVLLGFGALLLQIYSTHWGVGLSPDSAQYVAGARSLAHGTGFSFPDGDGTPVPITLWPPVFSILLAVPAMAGVDPVLCARVLNGLLFMGSVCVSGLLVARITGRLGLASLAAGILVLVSPKVVLIHSYAWSEPTFLFFGLLSLWLLDLHLATEKGSYLVGATVAAAVSMLARYPGLAFTIAGAIIMLGVHLTQSRRSLWKIAAYAAASVAPSVIWMVHVASISGAVAGRGLSLGGVSSAELGRLSYELSLWLVPGRITGGARQVFLSLAMVFVALLLILGLAAISRQIGPGGQRRRAPYAMLMVFAIGYSAILFASRMTIQPRFPLDDVRYWIPVYVALTILATASASAAYDRWAGEWAGVLFAPRLNLSAARALLPALVFGYIAIPQAFRTAKWTADAYETGLGFSSRSWHNTELITFVRDLPADTLLYSNGYDVLDMLTGRPAYPSPLTLHATPTRDENEYDADLSLMLQRLSDQHGYFVYFNGITWRRMASDKVLAETLPLHTVLSTGEGTVYTIPAP